ncbi:hypothetical protein AURDEDRAFT_116236 [Auricularia subglabra TFB-10046 SS5]|nr:hypothetical protein AURDEDRAFT_116236 [Auricularia subglabra TFB-10046 SS5]
MLRPSDSTPATARDAKTPAQKLRRFRWDLASLDREAAYRCMHAEIELLQAAAKMRRVQNFHRARFPVPPPREWPALGDSAAAVHARLANMRPSPLRNELDEAEIRLETGETSSAPTPAKVAPTPPAARAPLPRQPAAVVRRRSAASLTPPGPAVPMTSQVPTYPGTPRAPLSDLRRQRASKDTAAPPPPGTAEPRLPTQQVGASGPTTTTIRPPSPTPPQPAQTTAPHTPTATAPRAPESNNGAATPAGTPARADSHPTFMVHESLLLRTALWASLGGSVASPAMGALAFARAARKGRTVTDNFHLRPSHWPLSLCTSTILVKTRAPKSAKPASAAGREPLKPHNALKRSRDGDDNAEEARAAKRDCLQRPSRRYRGPTVDPQSRPRRSRLDVTSNLLTLQNQRGPRMRRPPARARRRLRCRTTTVWSATLRSATATRPARTERP